MKLSLITKSQYLLILLYLELGKILETIMVLNYLL